jgi:hypothetical protein
VVGVAACAATLVLHGYSITHPFLFDDDFPIIRSSWTWTDTVDNLWRPWNEHAMPLGRLTTWSIVQLAGDIPRVSAFAALQGPVAVLFGMWLLFVFMRRESGHPFYGLAAMILFGVTLKYNEAVVWFAASFAVLAMNTLLLALLAAQRWRMQNRLRDLALCIVWSALAPGWFAIGILAGPLCCIYLFRRRTWAWLAPVAGTALFLMISLSRNLDAIQYAEHFQGQSATQAFQPLTGAALTGRIIVDNLVLGLQALGTSCPTFAIVPILLLLIAVASWWGVKAVQSGATPQLLSVAGSLILLPYLLAYSFRANWPYEDMMIGWTRYNLLPYLGLVILICAGLPSRQGTLFRLKYADSLSTGQACGLTGLILLLLGLQLPPGIAGSRKRDVAQATQMECLQRVANVDERCRQSGISAEIAREALGQLEIPYSGDPHPRINGWELLRGSSKPSAWTVSEAKNHLSR